MFSLIAAPRPGEMMHVCLGNIGVDNETVRYDLTCYLVMMLPILTGCIIII